MITRRNIVLLVLAFALAVPAVSVVARGIEAEQYYVVGFVTSPGAYQLKTDVSVGDALDAAGGIAPGRTLSSVQIIRIMNGERETLDVSLDDVVRANDTISVR